MPLLLVWRTRFGPARASAALAVAAIVAGWALAQRPRFLPGLTIDLGRRHVIQDEREIRLTPTEFSLLELLATNAGRPLFIEQIIARVWRSAPSTTADTVRVHMSSLRKKLEPDPSDPRYIVTEPWVGYRFIAEPA